MEGDPLLAARSSACGSDLSVLSLMTRRRHGKRQSPLSSLSSPNQCVQGTPRAEGGGQEFFRHTDISRSPTRYSIAQKCIWGSSLCVHFEASRLSAAPYNQRLSTSEGAISRGQCSVGQGSQGRGTPPSPVLRSAKKEGPLKSQTYLSRCGPSSPAAAAAAVAVAGSRMEVARATGACRSGTGRQQGERIVLDITEQAQSCRLPD